MNTQVTCFCEGFDIHIVLIWKMMSFKVMQFQYNMCLVGPLKCIITSFYMCVRTCAYTCIHMYKCIKRKEWRCVIWEMFKLGNIKLQKQQNDKSPPYFSGEIALSQLPVVWEVLQHDICYIFNKQDFLWGTVSPGSCQQTTYHVLSDYTFRKLVCGLFTLSLHHNLPPWKLHVGCLWKVLRIK